MTARHKPGCPALGGYGHGKEPCACGAEEVTAAQDNRAPAIHPDMARWAEHFQQQRQVQDTKRALEASKLSQAQAKAANTEHDLLTAARMAGV